MNGSRSKNNLLFISSEQQTIDTFYRRCLNFTKSGNIVLLLTGSTKDLVPVFREAKLGASALKRFVVMTLENMDVCIQKLCEQHDWVWLPALVIVDVRTILLNTASHNLSNTLNSEEPNTTSAAIKPRSCLQQLALCIAHLFGYQESILKRFERRAALDAKDVQTAFSVLILDDKTAHFSRAQIELIINLYFYKNNAFDNLEEIFETITL